MSHHTCQRCFDYFNMAAYERHMWQSGGFYFALVLYFSDLTEG